MKKIIRKIAAITLAAVVAAGLLAGYAFAADDVVYRTVDEIKDSGTINIGVFSDKSPFGYVDEYGEYQGYDVYFAERLAQDLGVEINYVSTEAANRIEYLQTGKVDVILANFTVTEERAQEVDFALPYMNVALGIVSPDDRVIRDLSNSARRTESSSSPVPRQKLIWSRTIRRSCSRSLIPTQRRRAHLKTAPAHAGPMTTQK